MNSTVKYRTLGATALLAVLLGSAACGTETVNEPATQPGFEASASDGRTGGISADAAERKAATEQARQDQASADRWARGTQIENKLDQAGNSGRR